MIGIGTQSILATQTGYNFDQYGNASFEPIPEWIKNNAGWWASGEIPDSAFLSGLEWLIEHGIIILDIHEEVDPYDVVFSPLFPDIKQKNLEYVHTSFFHVLVM